MDVTLVLLSIEYPGNCLTLSPPNRNCPKSSKRITSPAAAEAGRVTTLEASVVYLATDSSPLVSSITFTQ